MTGAQAKATIRSRFVPPAQPKPVAEIRNATIAGPGGDIPVRIYRPDGDNYLPSAKDRSNAIRSSVTSPLGDRPSDVAALMILLRNVTGPG